MKIIESKEQEKEVFEMIELAFKSGKARLIHGFRNGAKVPVIAIGDVEGETAALIPVAMLLTDTEDVHFPKRPVLVEVGGTILTTYKEVDEDGNVGLKTVEC